jgi:glycosyltransferase involved in cell wall biosynthesis
VQAKHQLAEAARLMRAGIEASWSYGDGPRGEIEAPLEARSRIAVRVTGWISSHRVRAEILAARALILPSFAEGLPVVLMEAMALRRPVLSTYVAGIPELVIPGENGWLFPAGSI